MISMLSICDSGMLLLTENLSSRGAPDAATTPVLWIAALHGARRWDRIREQMIPGPRLKTFHEKIASGGERAGAGPQLRNGIMTVSFFVE